MRTGMNRDRFLFFGLFMFLVDRRLLSTRTLTAGKFNSDSIYLEMKPSHYEAKALNEFYVCRFVEDFSRLQRVWSYREVTSLFR